MLRTVSEAHADLNEFAHRLRRRLALKDAAVKAAFRAERAVFRLKRELERLSLEDPEPQAPTLLYRGGKVIDIERLRRGKET